MFRSSRTLRKFTSCFLEHLEFHGVGSYGFGTQESPHCPLWPEASTGPPHDGGMAGRFAWGLAHLMLFFGVLFRLV